MSKSETSILIPGPVGLLEVRLHTPPDDANSIGIICHPHPVHGGTMNNKVVTTLARTFKDLQMGYIRFNYRGVGQSEGDYDKGVGETNDTLAVIKWAKHHYPHKKIWLAGFSFGAYVSLCAATKLPVHQLISIAPAVNHADFSGLHPNSSWLVIIAGQDAIVPAEEIKSWIKTLYPKPDVLLFPEASHFFDGQLVSLRERLLEKLSDSKSIDNISYAHTL